MFCKKAKNSNNDEFVFFLIKNLTTQGHLLRLDNHFKIKYLCKKSKRRQHQISFKPIPQFYTLIEFMIFFSLSKRGGDIIIAAGENVKTCFFFTTFQEINTAKNLSPAKHAHPPSLMDGPQLYIFFLNIRCCFTFCWSYSGCNRLYVYN